MILSYKTYNQPKRGRVKIDNFYELKNILKNMRLLAN